MISGTLWVTSCCWWQRSWHQLTFHVAWFAIALSSHSSLYSIQNLTLTIQL